ncbi:T9SS type A sorting domain-containing protein [Flavobacterium sp.]|uniref:T9SS type A sorting domain-containing protein n=1 Tax=Flavobacterium sp. TaxID=239 RepID=UPI00261CA6B7|nr:T9SS type A sorting domain-containing protein [Flavobacterium sp.]
MKKIVIFLLFSTTLLAQIQYNTPTILIDETHFSSEATTAVFADLDGDNVKDFVIASFDDGSIMWYKNYNGDFSYRQRKIIDYEAGHPTALSVCDLDNDGINDIVLGTSNNGNLVWYRNMGGGSFSSAITIDPNNALNYIAAEDIDNDGDLDLITSIPSDETLLLYVNSGNGQFEIPEPLPYQSSYDPNSITIVDLNNDGLKDLVVGNEGGDIYGYKNLGGNTFSDGIFMGYANNGKAYTIHDFDNDGFADLIASDYYGDDGQIEWYKNLNGNSFANGTLIKSFTNQLPCWLSMRDMDNDGNKDILFITGTQIGWYKKNAGENFDYDPYIMITNKIYQPRTYAVDDVNNDGYPDIACSSNDLYDGGKRRVSLFIHQSDESYKPHYLNFFNSYAKKTKVADLDNDGNKDIISCFMNLIWHKNYGDGNFSSHKLVASEPIPNVSFFYDIEITDIDNDGDPDIVSTFTDSVRIFFNDGIGGFQTTVTLPLSSPTTISQDMEVADLNNDGFKDIVMTFSLSNTIQLGWIPSINGLTFGSFIPIDFPTSGFNTDYVLCCDVDLDGDIDLITYSNDGSKLHCLKNNGTAIFALEAFPGNVSSATDMVLIDYDNDGDKDVIVGGSYYAGIYLYKNNNGIFENKVLLEVTKVTSFDTADLNNDGFEDLLATAVDSVNNGTLIYLLNNTNNGFNPSVPLLVEGTSNDSRTITMADINNDNKLDILTAFSNPGKVLYYINSSLLNIENSASFDDGLTISPVPASSEISWKLPSNMSSPINISITDLTGKIILSKKKYYGNSLNLETITKGIYLFHIYCNGSEFSRKIVKN